MCTTIKLEFNHIMTELLGFKITLSLKLFHMGLIMYSFTQPLCFLHIDFISIISTLCLVKVNFFMSMLMIFQDSSYQMELCGIQFPADFGLHLLHLLCVCSLLCTCIQKYWKGTMEFQVSSWHLHSVVSLFELLFMHCGYLYSLSCKKTDNSLHLLRKKIPLDNCPLTKSVVRIKQFFKSEA